MKDAAFTYLLALALASCAPSAASVDPAPVPARCPRIVAVAVGVAPTGARCAVAYFDDGTTQAVCREERGS